MAMFSKRERTLAWQGQDGVPIGVTVLYKIGVCLGAMEQ